jgi:hypothetical protein
MPYTIFGLIKFMEERNMYKKLVALAIGICLVFLTFSCPTDGGGGCITRDMEEYGYGVYFVCLFLGSMGAPGSDSVTVGNVTTITFTNMEYSPPATVSGTAVYDAGVIPETEVSNLTFTNDPMGLTSIQTDMDWDGAHYSGTFTINGCDDPSPQAYQAYIESAIE